MCSSDKNDSSEDQSRSDASDGQVHSGYDIEAGVLSRAREWTDLLPWLRLIRVMRVAGSPPLVFLVAVTFAVWHLGGEAIFGEPVVSDREIEGALATSSGPVAMISKYALAMIPSGALQIQDRDSWWYPFTLTLWSLLIWLPTSLVLMRQGGLLTAGRSLMGFVDSGKFALRRSPHAFVIAVVPLFCVLCLSVALVAMGWISRAGEVIAVPLAALISLVAIACGLLAFGANIAVPLGWAAIVNEKEPDPLDSLSRGYEYLYRRPLALVINGLVGSIILTIVVGLAAGVATAAIKVSALSLSIAGAHPEAMTTSVNLLRCLPAVVAITLFWGLVGGVYLMMRRDANGQEVEDIWLPPSAPAPAIPELKK